MTEAIQRLAEEYKFIIETDSKNPNIDHVIFDDGRQYKFQHPSFMEFHEIMFSSEKGVELAAFEYALKVIYPENEKSPKIDAKYLNANFDESLYLWSPLLRRLLLRT